MVAGETGSGKSTQLPKMCLELGLGERGMIGHTQPRRLAARTIAERIATELGTDLGATVGYTVRFTDKVGDDTQVKVMTDGILLAELRRDRQLSAYDAIIVDEAHERSLNIDFILGYLKQLLPRRPDLKLIVTSATIDTARFAGHFDDAPVVEVSGRSYPVEIRYRPLGDDPDDDRDQTQAVCDAVEELLADELGDVLVFLSGEREIRDTADALSRLDLPRTELLPLYARLSVAEQHRVFATHRGRRVVLATNVAETSLTVPGIRSVIDAGTARISRYNRRTKVQRLPIEAVSQASADQRAGRCGRVAPGTCIRLYSEEDLNARPAFTEPEILRTNLASVILQMAAIGLGDIAAFGFVDPPDARSINDGVALLEELGALHTSAPGDDLRLTPVGRRLAQLPVDPRLGRMVLEADRNGCARDVLVIAAALAIQDPRERPTGKEQLAAESHRRFADPESDFLSLLALWDHLREQQRRRSSNQFRRICKAEFLNHLRVREWQDVHTQLRRVVRTMGIHPGRPTDEHDRDAVHRSVLAGLLSQIGMWNPEKEQYEGARGARFAIAPGSALAKKRPRWIMAAELVETNRLRARTVAGIRPDDIERLAAHLVTRRHSEPWWDAARGSAVADERVTLFGLPVVASRRVTYGTVDPEGARELFIRHALVGGEWDARHDFLQDNATRIAEVRSLEDRARRDLLVGDDELAALYDERVPPHVQSARHFDRWWRDERARRPDLLTFTPQALTRVAAGPVDPADFPDVWRTGELALDLSYRFDPDDELDGVTVEVPLAVLNQLDGHDFTWQVPGRRAELVTALLRSLPKAERRRFGPAPDVARELLAIVNPDHGALQEVLAAGLARLSGEPVSAASFQLDQVPDHLRITFRAVGASGRPVAWSKDLDALRAHLAGRVRTAIAEAAPRVEVSGLRSWTIGTLPPIVRTEHAANPVTGFPALIDEGDTVAVRVLASEADQNRLMGAGTRRLLLLAVGSPIKQLLRVLPDDTQLALAGANHATVAELLQDCAAAAVDRIVADHGGPAWDEAAFTALSKAVRAGFADVAAGAAVVVGQIVATAAGVERDLARLSAPATTESVADVRRQLSSLLAPWFVTTAGVRRLPDLLRYVRAVERRLPKLAGDPARDRRLLGQVQQLEQEYAAVAAGDPTGQVRWLLEELRVSLFAQVLGTSQPVSEPRIRRELQRLIASP
ncbi:ATP-dependent RNA helicase HrpA [soil metagenome]